ncbi:hypothetical protein RF55_20004 [Lasius niger]|uniref:Uncharacterized protein n=1 Tax=Lasius niger TaxID=67767 RepID=A0A0J7JZ38_LASNI|nr:hypothetical protein RF55_20004 [Lasius niger]
MKRRHRGLDAGQLRLGASDIGLIGPAATRETLGDAENLLAEGNIAANDGQLRIRLTGADISADGIGHHLDLGGGIGI